MARLGVVALAALACSCAAPKVLGVCPAKGGYPWRELTTAHFLVETDLDEDDARGMTLELERYRRAIALTWGPAFDPPGRLEAVVFRDYAELARFNTRFYGFFSAQGRRPLLVIPKIDPGTEEQGLTKGFPHELTHYLSHFAIAVQPRWLGEGLASYWGTTRLESNGTVAIAGLPSGAVLTRLRVHGHLPVENLRTWYSYQTRLPLEDYYASSWLLVHDLVEAHAGQFTDYQRRLANGEESILAWHQAFRGLSDAALDQELDQHLQGELRGFRFNVPPVELQATERPMTDAEVHVVTATVGQHALQASLEVRLAFVEHEVNEALFEDPASFEARLIEIDLARLKRLDPLPLARALTVAHPERGESWLVLGLALKSAADLSPERDQAFEKALALAPDEPRVLSSVAFEWANKGRAQEALALADKAVRLSPWSPLRLDAFAAVLSLAGRCERAVSAQRRAIDALGESAPTTQRGDFQARLDAYQRQCANGHP